jgi:hypothetical protein
VLAGVSIGEASKPKTWTEFVPVAMMRGTALVNHILRMDFGRLFYSPPGRGNAVRRSSTAREEAK